MAENLSVPVKSSSGAFYLIRGQKVMLDFELAEFYLVEIKVLNQAVRCNPDRYPEKFMFQATAEEGDS